MLYTSAHMDISIVCKYWWHLSMFSRRLMKLKNSTDTMDAMCCGLDIKPTQLLCLLLNHADQIEIKQYLCIQFTPVVNQPYFRKYTHSGWSQIFLNYDIFQSSKWASNSWHHASASFREKAWSMPNLQSRPDLSNSLVCIRYVFTNSQKCDCEAVRAAGLWIVGPSNLRAFGPLNTPQTNSTEKVCGKTLPDQKTPIIANSYWGCEKTPFEAEHIKSLLSERWEVSIKKEGGPRYCYT